MRVDIITLFPLMFKGPLEESIIKRAREKEILKIYLHDLRLFTHDKHRTVDDAPFGGGGGMVIKPEPLFEAVENIKKKLISPPWVILLSPQGVSFNQEEAKKLGKKKNIVLICGHYEGVDERVREYLIDEEISIGDYVLTGGELAAMVLVDAVARMIPDVLGCRESATRDSFYKDFLDYPQYTRPVSFRGWKVPEILFSGNHQEIKKWRKKKMIENTLRKRPDLFEKISLSGEEKELLEEVIHECQI